MAPYAHAFAGISLCAILVYAFNPILLQPAKALLLWTTLGLLVGVTLLGSAQVRGAIDRVVSMTDHLPTISLVTCSYQQARFLGATINSVLNQHYKPLDYIVIDGG